ncbi:MAG: protein kinase [Myxococcota bacterium]
MVDSANQRFRGLRAYHRALSIEADTSGDRLGRTPPAPAPGDVETRTTGAAGFVPTTTALDESIDAGSSGHVPEAGARIANFSIERTLGAGAMGVVLLARDADLGRRVAIKLLAPRYGDDAEAHKRLLREAQSVAQLQHPNVVALHQVGIQDGRVFLVMEYVDGGTLRQWVDAEPRTWREIVGVYCQAGAGLIAAHNAGLVHRDFKPDNVLIGNDGRVRVSDFGLVGAQGSEEIMETPVSEDLRLTQTGTVLGTPAYMAPEQFAGMQVDAAADQFAFCVSLFEALFGRRPFAGSNPGALLLSIESGELQPAPRGHRVPARVLRAIRRGLDPAPSGRHASLSTLVDLLQDSVRPKRTLQLAAAAAVAGVAVWVGTTDSLRGASPEVVAPGPTCAAKEPPLPRWSSEQRHALDAAIRATEHPDAEAHALRAIAGVDARLEALAHRREAACDEAGDAAAPRRRCIEEQIIALAATVDVLVSKAPPHVVIASDALLRDLPPVDVCDDARNLEGRAFVGLGPEAAAERELVARIWRARTWIRARETDRAALEVEALLDAIPASMPSPWLADATRLAADAPMSREDFAAAQQTLRDSVAVARAVDDTHREAAALAELIGALALDGQSDAALALAEQAKRAANVAGPEAAWLVHLRLAGAHKRAKQYPEADAEASLSLDILRSFSSARPRAVAEAHELRARALTSQNRLPEACEQYEAALAALAPYGPMVPQRAALLTWFGRTLGLRGDVVAARERFREAIEIYTANDARRQAELGNVYLQLGDLERNAQQFDAAAAALQSAGALWRDGPETQTLFAASLIELGIVEFMRGRNVEAARVLDEARVIAKANPEASDIDLARLEGMAGGVAVALGDLEKGLVHHRARLAVQEKRFGTSTKVVAQTHANLGDIAMYLRQCDDARASYRRALRIRADLGLPRDDEVVRISAGQTLCDAIDGDLGDARDGVERLEAEVATGRTAPWRTGRLEMIRAELAERDGDRARARRHAIGARAVYQSLGPAHTLDVRHIDRWLEAHPE